MRSKCSKPTTDTPSHHSCPPLIVQRQNYGGRRARRDNPVAPVSLKGLKSNADWDGHQIAFEFPDIPGASRAPAEFKEI